MLKIKVTPHTAIWMDNLYKKTIKSRGSRFCLSGFKGSLRWWYEALLRGLESYVCDPTDHNSACRLEISKHPEGTDMLEWIRSQICPACYLFGCNGFASRVQFAGVVQKDAGSSDEIDLAKPFHILIPNKPGIPLSDEELYLLKVVMDYISTHGAMGGRMTRKPSEESDKNTEKSSHKNFGVIDVSLEPSETPNYKSVKPFLSGFKPGSNNVEYPDLRYFWSINKVLDREKFNTLVGKPTGPQGGHSYLTKDVFRMWLGGMKDWLHGDQQGYSKKIFSFHNDEKTGNSRALPRTFGYTKAQPDSKEEFKKLLKKFVSPVISPESIQWGTDFLKERS